MDSDALIILHPNQESKSGKPPYASFARRNFSTNDWRFGSAFWREAFSAKSSFLIAMEKLAARLFRK